MKIRIADLFCGQGGAAVGYKQACDELGIECEITGCDIVDQPRYPFRFVRMDAFEFIGRYSTDYDFFHASPNCQLYSIGTKRWNNDYPDYLGIIEDLFSVSGRNFVIENVERAPFRLKTITLCGIQFGLNVIRHRKFASNIELIAHPHDIKHPKRGEFVTCAGHGGNGSNRYADWCNAMRIYWMSKQGLSQAIPYLYTKYVGIQVFAKILTSR